MAPGSTAAETRGLDGGFDEIHGRNYPHRLFLLQADLRQPAGDRDFLVSGGAAEDRVPGSAARGENSRVFDKQALLRPISLRQRIKNRNNALFLPGVSPQLAVVSRRPKTSDIRSQGSDVRPLPNWTQRARGLTTAAQCRARAHILSVPRSCGGPAFS